MSAVAGFVVRDSAYADGPHLTVLLKAMPDAP